MKHYIVLDFEMCKVPKGSRCKEYHRANEIIQIGAVLLDEDYDVVDEFNCYVKPQYGKLDAFISKFTGITWNEIEKAPNLDIMLNLFSEWLPDGEIKMVAWSDNDQKQLYGEMESKNIIIPRIEEVKNSWIDCQLLYADKIHNDRNYSLEEALYACDIDIRGRMHDGLSDAYNTGMLFKKLMTEYELQLNPLYASAKTETAEHLTCTLGDLFNGINLMECLAV